MKKTLIIAAIAVALLAVMGPAPAGAVQVKIGLAGMYDIWDPPFKKLHEGKSNSLIHAGLKDDADGSLMLGPALNLKWGGWRMDLQALFGVMKNEFDYTNYRWDLTLWNLPGFGQRLDWITVGDYSARRYDVDLKFGKSIVQYLYFNFGARFNWADGSGSQFRIAPGPGLNFGEDDFRYFQVGPIIGIGFEYEIKGFSFYFDVNGIVNFGNHNLERKYLFPFPWSYVMPFKYDTDIIGFGFDTDIGMAYFIAPAHISIGVGFRWVGVVCVPGEDDSSMIDFAYRDKWVKGKWDHFYGFTFNVSARF